MGWITNLSDDPFKDRFVIGLSGSPGIGKTSAVLELAQAGQLVFLISMDSGTSRVRLNPAPYQNRLAINYIAPVGPPKPGAPWSFKTELEEAARELVNVKIPELVNKGVPLSKIWVCLDTVTHMQQRLLNEVREMTIENPDYRDSGKKRTLDGSVRNAEEYLTQLDYNINAGMMTSISEIVYRAGCNIVLITLIKMEEIGKLKKANPAIQGASYQKFLGDADIWLYLEQGPQGHCFHTRAAPRWEAKDRFNKLLEPEMFEPLSPGNKVPALLRIRRKIFSAPVQTVEEKKE